MPKDTVSPPVAGGIVPPQPLPVDVGPPVPLILACLDNGSPAPTDSKGRSLVVWGHTASIYITDQNGVTPVVGLPNPIHMQINERAPMPFDSTQPFTVLAEPVGMYTIVVAQPGYTSNQLIVLIQQP